MSAINGALLGAGMEKDHTFYKSDHNAVGARMNMSIMIGRTSTDKTVYKPPKRMVKSAIPERKEEYHDIAQKRYEKQKETHQNILTKSEKALKLALKLKREGNKKQRKQLQQRMNKIMNELTYELLTIENNMSQSKNIKSNSGLRGGKAAKHGWSDVFSKKNLLYNNIMNLFKCSVQPRKRTGARQILAKIKDTGCNVGEELQTELGS